MPTTWRSEAESSTIMMVLAMGIPCELWIRRSEEGDFLEAGDRRGSARLARVAGMGRALVGHRVAALELAQERGGVDRAQRARGVEGLAALGDERGQALDVVAHVVHALADAVLELQ